MQTLSLDFNHQIVQNFRLNSIIILNFEPDSNPRIELLINCVEQKKKVNIKKLAYLKYINTYLQIRILGKNHVELQPIHLFFF
jgi:hypothetical protein